MKDNKLIAIRCSDFDYIGEDRPYAVVLDVYDSKGNYIEQGTDWTYFETEKKAEDFINEYNQNK